MMFVQSIVYVSTYSLEYIECIYMKDHKNEIKLIHVTLNNVDGMIGVEFK